MSSSVKSSLLYLKMEHLSLHTDHGTNRSSSGKTVAGSKTKDS